MTIDQVLPEGQWKFDADVADAFDDMLARSIPQYDVMRATVSDVAARYLPADGKILDLGCSRGGAIAALLDQVPTAYAVGIDVAAPMLDAATRRFAENPRVEIRTCDLRETFPAGGPFDVVLAVLTLQFVPIEYRQELVLRIYEQIRPGGALLVVEKLLGATGRLNREMVALYLEGKRKAGYSAEQIERKRLALEGVLVPVTARWNEELLRSAGFREVDCIWRWLNFAGWVAIP